MSTERARALFDALCDCVEREHVSLPEFLIAAEALLAAARLKAAERDGVPVGERVH
jgi:hypothetical protein